MLQATLNQNVLRTSPKKYSLIMVLVGIELLILFAPTVHWLVERWTLSVWHNAHGLLIAVVAIYYAWLELCGLSHLPRKSSGWGFLFLIPALLLFVLDTGMHTQLLSAFALFLSLPGLSLLFLGTHRTKAISFFLCMLFLSLPIPLVVTNSLHLILRELAAHGTAWIVPKLGIPLFREGTALHISNGTLQVADACSGFSTLYAAIAVACITAYFCTNSNRRILIMLIAAPIAIASNVLRVVLLVLLVNTFGVEILDTSLHTISGLFTFALTLPVIFWLGKESPLKEAKA